MTQHEDIEKEIKQLGERIALLLVASDLSDEVKAGFVAMIPEMTAEQLDRLIVLLESNVKETAALEEQQLGRSVQKAQKAYETAHKEEEKKAINSLKAIENLLNQ
ncbi:MAG: hypothetical protein UT30_C0006G0036 [Candidatus Uhrbacteria bacterium GW2011_GWF2_39_13]|uniref:Uncharacterized protein n=1 Tax=Candidatus Uhrbacteria bacterium GW2011_GWF2_39_13 TaxID=1618995 RepID=A0A0G0QSD0_9BACT|nr:MAG: hypothetical protein UT30_C0006G0036 [Candidatus Uhrbacteria bacterium GW2011_GWF2_39_13]